MPLGLTQVIAAAQGIPRRWLHSSFVVIATSFNLSRVLAKPLFVVVSSLLSIIPVSDTPNSRSSSVFRCHTFRKYGNFVSVDCIVPRIVARRTFRSKSSTVSVDLTTTSVRLQN